MGASDAVVTHEFSLTKTGTCRWFAVKLMIGGWHLLLGFCWSGQPLRRLLSAPSACFCNEETDEGYHFMLDLQFGRVVVDHIEPYWWKSVLKP